MIILSYAGISNYKEHVIKHINKLIIIVIKESEDHIIYNFTDHVCEKSS